MARFRISFWLDANKDDELLLLEDIDRLKGMRKFTRTVRDGIRLMIDLQEGKVDVLFELFPDLKKRLNSQEIGHEAERLARMEEILLKIDKSNELLILDQPHHSRTSNKPKTRELMSPDEEDLDLLEVKKDSKSNSSENFLRSLMALQQ